MNRRQVVFLGAVVVLLLGLLASGVASIQWRGARGTAGPDLSSAPPMSPSPPAPESLQRLVLIFLYVMLGFGVLCLVIALAVPDLRRTVLRYLLASVLIAALLLYLYNRTQLEVEAVQPEDQGTGVAVPAPPPLPAKENAPEPPTPPDWAVYVTALGLAGGALFLGWRLWLRRIRSRQVWELREAVHEAVTSLEQGAPWADVVIQCWDKMIRILSRRVKGIDAPQMTPREAALHLRALGFTEEAIAKLTALFEEVRYGRKESEPRRAEALAALSAVEQAYG